MPKIESKEYRSLTPHASPGEKIAVMGFSFLVPGGGYAMKGDWKLFWINFLILSLVFWVGVIGFHGAVFMPELDNQSPEFSLINILMLAGQLLNGAFALFSFFGTMADPHFLGASASHWASDLGGFYLLIAGTLNVFVLFGIWDRYYSRSVPAMRHDAEQEPRT